jgi:EAL domain-containing protein (putative c-di-GMP-specific phosphodiesterase class I)
MADRLHRELEQPFQVDGQTLYISATTGITLSNTEYGCPEELLRDASTAMHRAKKAGKGRCEIFDREMRAAVVTRIKLESDFRRAIDQEELRVHYQPIVSLKNGKLEGFEALVRWQRPSGIVFPGDFLPLAESTELIMPMENWVLLESCRQLAKWQDRSLGGRPLTVNVNLCAQHYASPDLLDDLEAILKQSGLPAESLRLEITESTLMENTATISQTLSRIQDLRIQVHMDDFGTGYSSLSYLHRFPINTLKVDRSFVGNLGLNKESHKIVQAIVNLAQNLGMEVIAEGIENLMQMRMLQALGCEFGQGYYLSKALEPRAIESLMEGQSPWSMAFAKEPVRAPMISVPAYQAHQAQAV